MNEIKVQIVTPVHNRREITLGFLRSLDRCDFSGLDVGIIVVDDGSTDGTFEAIRGEFPGVKIIAGDGNLWYSAGMNAGITAAMDVAPKYILGVNNDCEFDHLFLKKMVATAETNRRSVVGAVLVNWENRTSIFQVAPKWSVWWGGMRHWVKQTIDTLPKDVWEVDAIVGNCVLFPADAVREIGLMDAERLPQYGDAEYTTRMRKAGWTLLIDPAARVFCKPNDVPARYGEMSMTGAIRKTLFDPYSPHSLRRRINSTIGSAPNKLAGYAAVGVFFLRLLLGRNLESDWALTLDEKPLSEIYRDKTLTDERFRGAATSNR